MDLPFLKKKYSSSPPSPGNDSNVPVLQSPSTGRALSMMEHQEKAPKDTRKTEQVMNMSSVFVEEDSLTRELTRGTPTDSNSMFTPLERKPSEQEAVRRRNQYFEDSFSTREPHNAPRYRVNQDAIVVIEIKTNARVTADEFQLLSDLSSHLAQIYHRPENSILVAIEQNACLLFGSSPTPAYLMTVSALPYLIAPITNLRNTILIQQALQDILRISPSRGVIKYNPVSEENFATNGVTVMGEIEQLERNAQGENPGILKSISRSMSRKLKSSSSHSTPLSLTTTSSFPLIAEAHEHPMPTAMTGRNVQATEDGSKPQTVKKTQSIRNFVTRRLSELGSMSGMQ